MSLAEAEAMMPLAEHERVLDALHQKHRFELNIEAMKLVRYRQLLEEHGIEPPDNEGQEFLQMWRDAQAVISTASEFVHKLGTSRELLSDAWSHLEGRPDPWTRPFVGRWRG